MSPRNVAVKSTAKVSATRTNPPNKHGSRKSVLAERNQAVVPVGAWVEGGRESDSRDEHPAVRAVLTAELQEETRREKEESLRRFQAAVRRRVAQQADVRKSKQLQKSRETVEREGRVLQQSSDAAQRLLLSPRKKNLYPSSPRGELAICSPNSRWVAARGEGHQGGGVGERSGSAPPADQQQRSRVVRQVRLRLAGCRTVGEGEVMSELPGGLWKVSPTRDKPVSRVTRHTGEEEEEEEEEDDEVEEEDVPLTGQHDCPLIQQNIDPYGGQGNKTVTFDANPVCERLSREPYASGPSLGFRTDYRATQVLWPQDNQEEMKRQRHSQFLTYRRLFMDIEREQVKERQRHRKHLQRIARIKADKEERRQEEERKMERLQRVEEDELEMAEREFLVLERLRLEEEKRAEALEKRERDQKDREASRYVEALRAQMRERLALEKASLPPLCCCGDGFWDSHPDTCANNCVFYGNPRVYVQALQSALSSCDLKEGSAGLHHKSSARKMAAAHALSPRR